MTALPSAPEPLLARDERLMRLGAASIWLTTGLGVLHPYYREVGHEALARLGLPDVLMWLTCAAEVVLAVVIASGPPRRWVSVAQVGAVSVFSAILAIDDPWLLVHPFGILTKNVPFVALVIAADLAAREGWSPRARWILRGGMASIWVTEGLFPKVLFQQPMELAVVARSGLVPMDPGVFLAGLGVAQTLSGVLALVAARPWARLVVGAQLAALVLLPVLVSWPEPTLWVHPFGPMTKNLPMLAGHLVVLRRCLR